MKAKECLKSLMKLMREHPELPVLPMVDSEIVCDDGYSRWTASWGDAFIGKYFVGEEYVYFYDDTDESEMDSTLLENLSEEECEDLTGCDLKKAYDKLPWIEAIIVDINVPED